MRHCATTAAGRAACGEGAAGLARRHVAVCHATEQHRLYPFTVLTTFPNEVSATVLDRMPTDVIAPPPTEGWIAYPVSQRVNSPKNDDAELIEKDAGKVGDLPIGDNE